MRAGDLRDRITFQEHTSDPDGAGGSALTWADKFTLWGQIMVGSVRERLEAGRLQASSVSMLRVRYSQQALAIQPDWRIIVNGDAEHPYQIRSIPEDPYRSRQVLDMQVEKGVAT